MDILVCVKQVPGTTHVEVDPVTGILKRDGAPGKLNPYDLFAVELALQLRAETGGTVTTLSMGPPQAREALLETVYMGADRGVLASDRRFAGADVLSTAHTLACAIKKIGHFDLIICGKQTTDGDTAQVGAELAELLDLVHSGNVLAVRDISMSGLTADISLDKYICTQRMPLPCVLGTDAEVNTPRLPSYKRKKQVLAECVTTLCLDDFDDRDELHFGSSGSATRVERIFPPEKNSDKELFEGDDDALATKIAQMLKTKKFI
ncbi:MAG: electron transfer flavoprotein subunit beta/FixA family protein [Oscillospiraceae bacterium]